MKEEKNFEIGMPASVQMTLIIVVGAIFLAVAGMVFYNSNSGSNTVNVQGESTVDIDPDLIVVYFNVETKDASASAARDKNSEIVDSLIDSLIRQGFSRDEIITENFNVYPNYNYNGNSRVLNGYIATHSIKVELSSEELDKVGDVVDAGIDSGALISYISFELSQEKQNEAKAKALELATEDARVKAEGIANGLDKEVGRLVSVSTYSFNYNPWRVYDYAESSGMDVAIAVEEATTNIQPGQRKVYGSVSAVFKLK